MAGRWWQRAWPVLERVLVSQIWLDPTAAALYLSVTDRETAMELPADRDQPVPDAAGRFADLLVASGVR